MGDLELQHPLANCGPLTLELPSGTQCPTCGISAGSRPTELELRKLRDLWPTYPEGFWA